MCPCFKSTDIHTEVLAVLPEALQTRYTKISPQKKEKKRKNGKYATEFLKLVRVTSFFLGQYLQNPYHSGLFFFFSLMTADSLGDHKPLWVESVWRTVTTVYLMDTERDRNDCEPQGVSGYLCVVPISLGV